MVERPIIFSTPMVQAILAGRKTQTRRIIKPQPDDGGLWDDTNLPRSLQSDLVGWNGTVDLTGESKEFKCPYGQQGDRLWVREAFYKSVAPDGESGPCYYFKATADPIMSDLLQLPWKPSIHMPRAAARLFLQVLSVRVERLNDITSEDAAAEGLEFDDITWGETAYPDGTIDRGLVGLKTRSFKDYLTPNLWHIGASVKSFSTLWDSINGDGAWNRNPWVWVIEFKRLRTHRKWRTNG